MQSRNAYFLGFTQKPLGGVHGPPSGMQDAGCFLLFVGYCGNVDLLNMFSFALVE